MNAKRLLAIVFLLGLAAGMVEALDGFWRLRNSFYLAVMNGHYASFDRSTVDLIDSIQFVQPATESGKQVAARITMVSLQNDQLEEFEAKVIYEPKIRALLILVPRLNNLYIILNILPMAGQSQLYWYSYALSFDSDKDHYVSEKDSTSFFTYFGMMKRMRP